eukprot:TRINITY_DN9343_c0_g1_i1.p1 TRINITY_DN9343_c0_g1~~TRINITY_DN9343_c0_g1_i1.p1  ORF type:complete len:341 (+),score=104.80 TRINITY_DN9343_c0_g1_i1:98-1120(+)
MDPDPGQVDEPEDMLPVAEEGMPLRLQPAATFTATNCPHCEQVFEVQIDFEEIRDNVEFERLKRKELEAQKEQYKQEITRVQEEVNSLKETLANLCNQLAQAQVENLRSKQASVENDGYIKQLKGHLQESESELHHLGHDFSLCLGRNKELHNAHLRNTGQIPPRAFTSRTAREIVGGGGHVPGADLGPLGAEPDGQISAPTDSTPSAAPPVDSGVAGLPQAERRAHYRNRLIEFYSVHNPAKVGEVDAILQEFAGHEEEMLVMLARKYCTAPIVQQPIPTPVQGPPGTGPSLPPAGSPAYSGNPPPPLPGSEDEDLLRVAPWTSQMRQARRGQYPPTGA